MTNTIVLAFTYLVGIGLLLGFNEINYRHLKVQGEITRKFAHFAATLATIPLPYIFDSHWYVLGLASVFFIFLFATQHIKQLNSIHDIKRKSIGSYLLPASIYITFLISDLMDNKFLYILPMLILAICDPMAAILGMNFEKYNRRYRYWGFNSDKSIVGSLGFLIFSFVISLIALYYHRYLFDVKAFVLAFSIAVISTLGELFSYRGSDNLSIPLSVVLLLVLFL